MRRLVPVLAALLLLAPSAARADTTAVAINTKDGFEVFRLAFRIHRAAGDVVDHGNAAVAYASCSDCQTIALAIQVVLVFGDPSVVTPENLALALNVGCSACDTLASAYQFVLSTGGPVHFTAAGNRRLAELRRALLELRDSGLSGVEIQQRVDTLMEELADLLATELVTAGPPAAASPVPTVRTASPDPTSTGSPATPEPTPTGTASPAGSPSPSHSATPTASGSP